MDTKKSRVIVSQGAERREKALKKKYQIDISEILAMLKGKGEEPAMLLNVGVGQLPHNEAEQFLEVFPDIQIIGFEPQIKTFLQRAKDYPGKIYPIGLNEKTCLGFLNLTEDQGNTSLLEPEARLKVKSAGTQLAPLFSLDQLHEKLNFPERTFLWMDIEGSEVYALMGAWRTFRSKKVNWVLVEVSNKPRRVGEGTERDTTDILNIHGFEKWFEFDNNPEFKNIIYRRNQ